jgi:hypothetical protein
MPLVQYFKARQAHRFHRAKKLKGRPEWQDMIPTTREGRDAYAIAAKHEKAFSQAFLEAQRSILDDDTKAALKEAWNKGAGLTEILNIIPTFNRGATDQLPVWRKFMDKVKAAYTAIVEEAGQDALDVLNEKLKLKNPLQFTLSSESVQKKAVPIVPPNPYSQKWIEERSLQLVEQGVTQGQVDTLRAIIGNAYDKGLRGQEVIDQIERNIGLTEREYEAVERRRELYEDEGWSKDEVDEMTDAYESDLLRSRANRIARTETTAAQAHGRNAAWQSAKEADALPPVERVWTAPPASPNPNRPCEICLDLDGKTADIGEPYDSEELGPIDHPPAHPNCRCTEVLRRVRE